MSEQLINDNINALQQAEQLLLAVIRDGINYADRIGPHLRHVLDHYDSFLAGLPRGALDYDERRRDRVTETRVARAQQRIEKIQRGLRELNPQSWPRELQVRLATSPEHPVQCVRSTPERELQFLQSHAVHHYALIRLQLEIRGCALDADFGKAPSSLRFERAQAG